MATIKIKFRPSSIDGKEGTLFYQVIHNRVARQINTGYRMYSAEWNDFWADKPTGLCDDSRRNYINCIRDKVECDICRIKNTIVQLECRQNSYTSEDVVRAWLSPEKKDTMFSFTERLIERLKEIGKVRLGETYATTLNSFIRFRGGEDVPLKEMDSDLMTAYEAYLKNEGVCPNSSSFYMRNLRAVYNRALDKQLITQSYPFKHVYTGIEKTVKRAIPLKEIRRIRQLDLRNCPVKEYVRDLFLFSFYVRGCSFIDMAFMKKTDLDNGILSYRRRKTGQQLFVRWEPCMQDIVDKYNRADSPYLLPVIRSPGTNERPQYTNAAHLVNRNLKDIGRMLKLPIPLTMYVARHAWASIAKSKNVPISVISEGMGHDSEATTKIYLASLDTSVIDKANRLILKSI